MKYKGSKTVKNSLRVLCTFVIIKAEKFFIRGEGLIPRPLGRETNRSPLSMLGIKPETNTSGERNTPLLAAGYFISLT